MTKRYIWHCPNDNCSNEFRSLAALKQHTEHQMCNYKQTGMDKVKDMYVNKLNLLSSSTTSAGQSTRKTSRHRPNSVLPKGWAQKKRKEAKRCSKEMMNWVVAHFLKGERSGKKVNGEELAKLQRLYFEINEYKTASQFKGLLSRMLTKYRQDCSKFSSIDIVSFEKLNEHAEDCTDEGEYCEFTQGGR